MLTNLSFVRGMFPQLLISTKTPYSPSTQPPLYSRVLILYLRTCVYGFSPQRVPHCKGNIVIKDPKGKPMALSIFLLVFSIHIESYSRCLLGSLLLLVFSHVSYKTKCHSKRARFKNLLRFFLSSFSL